MSKHRSKKQRRSTAKAKHARRLLELSAGNLSLYATYLVIFFRLLVLVLRGVDFPHA
jgi:hypothetical protein